MSGSLEEVRKYIFRWKSPFTVLYIWSRITKAKKKLINIPSEKKNQIIQWDKISFLTFHWCHLKNMPFLFSFETIFFFFWFWFFYISLLSHYHSLFSKTNTLEHDAGKLSAWSRAVKTVSHLSLFALIWEVGRSEIFQQNFVSTHV